ncbi:MAG: MobF family relaxase [Phycisphaerales bacterium]
MLRIHQSENAAAAQSYFTQGLTREDYYIDGHEIAGRWGGKGAERLGLLDAGNPSVTRDGFIALTENRHPMTGERLTMRQRLDRTIGYDMNFHAPKGVSLLHAIHGDERIVEVFRAVVHQTMLDIEADAATRVRKGGKQEDRTTGNLVWGEFVHLTARPVKAKPDDHPEPDPHLHAHCFVFNATYDEVEEAWKAGQFRHLKRDAPYYQAAFHSRLAQGLQSIGYPITRTATGWDLDRIPRSLVEKYSGRTKEIEAYAAEKGITDPVAKGQLGARTRSAKDKFTSIADLHTRWQGRLSDDEKALLASIDRDGRNPPAAVGVGGDDDGPSPRDPAELAVAHAIAHCFERRSTMPMRRLAAEALRAGIGRTDVDSIWKVLDQQPLLSRMVRGERIVTTQGVLGEEKSMVQYAVDGKGKCAPIRDRIRKANGEDWTIKDERLDADQRKAVGHVLDSRDRVMAIRGAAGVGKTTMMTEAIEAIRAGGHSVVVVAPTADAARGSEGLRAKGFTSADTVSKLLSDRRLQEGLKNRNGGGVLWVDEAGLLGAGTMKKLFDLAKKHDARVVLCGDQRQHKPVERGDALRVLERLGGITPAELTSIRRQKGLYREAVMALSKDKIDESIERLDRLGAFHEIKDRDARIRAATNDYMATTASGKSAVVISPTHAEGNAVARAIRSEERAAGRIIGEDHEYRRLRDTRWTEAERAEPRNYEKGLFACFHQHAKGVVAGDACEILGTHKNKDGHEVVRARTPRGVEIDLPIGNADRFQVYKPESIDLAVGDRVRITRNGRTVDGRARLVNGGVHTVTGFTEHGAIVLDGGKSGRGKGVKKIVPRDFGHLSYASVLTSHAAQGRDASRAILVQSSASQGAASAEQFYVSISRGRDSVVVYTDDKQALFDAVHDSAARLAGIELLSGLCLESERKPKRDAMRDRAIDVARGASKQNGQRPAPEPRRPDSGDTPKPVTRPVKPTDRGRPRDQTRGRGREHER